jgi:nicotinamide mononucleotide transporter
VSMLTSLSYFQWGGFVFGIIYIIIAAKKYNHSWIYGLFSAVSIIIEDYTNTHLYVDGFLHILYALMAIAGIILWRKGQAQTQVIRISKMPRSSYLGYLCISLIIGGALGYLLDNNTDAQYAYLDAFSSTLAVFATFLVIYRVLNVWTYWLLINLISIYLYWQTGAILLSLLYIAYLISNIMKWKQWNADYQSQRA